jgi:polygalacturonase
MTGDPTLGRRGLMAAGVGIALGAAAAEAAYGATPPKAARMLSATHFGAIGDGVADDSAALQSALESTFAEDGGFLVIPPGRYKVTRTLRVTL